MEPVMALAQLSRFIIADVTDAKIVLEELTRIVPNVAIPVQPVIRANAGPEPTTIQNLRINHLSVLPTYSYRSEAELLRQLKPKVIDPAEKLVKDLLRRRIDSDAFRGTKRRGLRSGRN